MRHIALLVTLAIVVFLGSIACGEDEPGPLNKHLKSLDWLVGQWTHESVYRDVSHDERERELVHCVRVCCMWTCDRQTLVSVGVESIDNRILSYSVTLVGWRAEMKQIIQFGLDTSGRYGDATICLTDDTSTGKHRMFLPDGRLIRTTHTMKRIDHDSYTLQFTDSTADGIEVPDGPIMLFKRVQK